MRTRLTNQTRHGVGPLPGRATPEDGRSGRATFSGSHTNLSSLQSLDSLSENCPHTFVRARALSPKFSLPPPVIRETQSAPRLLAGGATGVSPVPPGRGDARHSTTTLRVGLYFPAAKGASRLTSDEIEVQTDRSEISRHLQRYRGLWVSVGFSSAETEGRASSSSLCGAVISSFRWSIAAIRQSHDAGIPQPRVVRRSAGLPRGVPRWRAAT